MPGAVLDAFERQGDVGVTMRRRKEQGFPRRSRRIDTGPSGRIMLLLSRFWWNDHCFKGRLMLTTRARNCLLSAGLGVIVLAAGLNCGNSGSARDGSRPPVQGGSSGNGGTPSTATPLPTGGVTSSGGDAAARLKPSL